MGYFGLGFRGNGADGRCVEGGRPLTENESRSAGRGMNEDQVTRLDGIHLPDQHLSSHTLQHHRGCLMERDCIRLAQAHLTRPGLTDIDRCPVQNLGTARLPNLDRMKHTDFRKNMNSLISSCKTENSTTSLLSRLWCHLSTIKIGRAHV